MVANINLRDLEEVFLQAMVQEEVADLEEIAKAILTQDHLEEQMAILIQDRLEVADQEEAQMEIHLLSQTEGLVRIEIHRDQEVKHWV